MLEAYRAQLASTHRIPTVDTFLPPLDISIKTSLTSRRDLWKMVFLPAKDAGELPPIPDNIPISEFMLNEKHGRKAHDSSRDPFTCGFTGKTYSSREVVDRVDYLARGLSNELNWAPNQGSEWDKTLAVFTLNTVCGNWFSH